MAMDQFLAQLYNTNTPVPPSAEETEKAAQVDLFVKAAAANNLDLETLPRDQVETLFNSFVENLQGEKVAAAASQEGGETVTEDLARQQWEEKAAAARKFAEYDFGGRVMAHAYVDEMRKIAADLQKKEEEEEEEGKGKEKQAGRAADVALRGLGALNAGVGAAGDAAKRVGGAVAGAAKAEKARHHISELRRPLQDWEKKGPHRKHHGIEAAKGVGQTAALYGGGAAGVGGAGYAAHKALSKKDEGEKEASAPDFDQVSAGYALDLIDAFNKEAGADAYDIGTAEQRLTAILVLGVPESTKTASASDFDTAKHIRALELLELAGYPISWGG